MDSVIAALPAVQDDDLMLCREHGIAYQRDMDYRSVRYDAGYLAKIDAYDGTAIALAVNAGRCAMMSRHLSAGASVLDVGAGSGAFVRAACAAGFAARGYDIIAAAAVRLRVAGLYAGCEPSRFDAVTTWDTLEHLDDAGPLLRQIPWLLFASVPVFADLSAIRESRHYRPGEHLIYWTIAGFVRWADWHGFRLIEHSSHEIDAGRDSIGAFSFRRYRWVNVRFMMSHDRESD